MATTKRMVPVAGSERFAPPGARLIGPTPPEERVSVTIYVRKRRGAAPIAAPEEQGTQLPRDRHYLTAEEFSSAYGADPEDVKKVEAFARSHGLDVVRASPVERSVLVSGDAAAIQAAFGVELHEYEAPGRTFRGRVGPVHVPEELSGVVDAVFGLDDRHIGKSRLRRGVQIPLAREGYVTRAAGFPPFVYYPPTVANLYRFPPGTDGSGQCIAILAFNDPTSHGGYSRDALRVYFEQVLRMTMPDVTDVVVHGQGNDPGTDDGSDPADATGEIMLDVQVTGSVAPKAKLVVYFTQFTEQGWVDVINTVLADTKHSPSVISISYGNPEDDPRSAWTAQAIRKTNEAFRAAAARGITVCCASGDDGSRDQALGPRAHADFPASSPFVLGCGGTRVLAWGNAIANELVWNDGPGSATGGGISRLFPLPPWQTHVGVPPSANPEHRMGRGVPDVSGIADPNTGVIIITVDGQQLAVTGGTSVTAPLWSALIARLNQALGASIGYLNPLLYSRFASGILRDITIGNNGAYQARPGWDACTGLGSPDGVNLLTALRGDFDPPHLASEQPAVRKFKEAWEQFASALQNAWVPEIVRERGSGLHEVWLRGASAAWRDEEARRQLQEAYRQYTEAVQEAWQPGAFAKRSAEAFRGYVDAIRSAWQSIDPASLDPEAVNAIAKLLAAAASQAALSGHGAV